jgi:hypothetical protein
MPDSFPIHFWHQWYMKLLHCVFWLETDFFDTTSSSPQVITTGHLIPTASFLPSLPSPSLPPSWLLFLLTQCSITADWLAKPGMLPIYSPTRMSGLQEPQFSNCCVHYLSGHGGDVQLPCNGILWYFCCPSLPKLMGFRNLLLHLLTWKWRKRVSQKFWYPSSTELHTVTFQKTVILSQQTSVEPKSISSNSLK